MTCLRDLPGGEECRGTKLVSVAGVSEIHLNTDSSRLTDKPKRYIKGSNSDLDPAIVTMSESQYALQDRSQSGAVQQIAEPVPFERPSLFKRKPVLLAGATLSVFTVCGQNFAYGVFQEEYERVGGPFEGASSATIALIVSVQGDIDRSDI